MIHRCLFVGGLAHGHCFLVDTAVQHDVVVRHFDSSRDCSPRHYSPIGGFGNVRHIDYARNGREERYFLHSHINMFYPVFVSHVYASYHPNDIDKLILDARLDCEEGRQETPASAIRRDML